MATPQLYKATGIIIKRNNSGEGDKVITVLCEHFGKKRFIGKGIRKINSRRAPHIELFSKTNFLIHRGKTTDYITGAEVVGLYGTSYIHLGQIAAAYTACEIIDRMILENQEQDESFHRLDGFLSDLGAIKAEMFPEYVITFIDDILKALGYRRKELKSTSLNNAIYSVERIIERKLRSTKLLVRSGMAV